MNVTRNVFALIIAIATAVCVRADQSVTLAWDPSSGSDIAGYTVHYGTAPRAYTQSTNVGNVTTATVYGLREGLTHYFAVTAQSSSGLASDWSNEVTNSIPASVTNRVPTIAPLPALAIGENQSTNVVVSIWDVETPPQDLEVIATSTNTTLLPDSGIAGELSDTDHQRIMRLTPRPGQSGQTLVTVVVSDGTKAASTSFVLTVLPLPRTPLVWLRTIYQYGPSPTGPWKYYMTTNASPIELDPSWWWKTWL